jgi:hypothetical protein
MTDSMASLEPTRAEQEFERITRHGSSEISRAPDCAAPDSPAARQIHIAPDSRIGFSRTSHSTASRRRMFPHSRASHCRCCRAIGRTLVLGFGARAQAWCSRAAHCRRTSRHHSRHSERRRHRPASPRAISIRRADATSWSTSQGLV